MRLATGRFGTGGRCILPGFRKVNWNNPLASRLVWFAAPGLPSTHELLTGTPGFRVIFSGNKGEFGIPTRMGLGAGSLLSGPGVGWTFSPFLLRITRDFTFVLWTEIFTTNSGYMWNVNYDGSTFWKSMGTYYDHPTQTMRVRFCDNGGNLRQANGPANFYTGGTDGLRCLAFRREGSNCDYFRDGVYYGNSSFGSNADVDWNTKEDVSVATRTTYDPGDGIICSLPLVHLFEGQLTDAEILSLYAQPLQLLEEDIPLVGPVGTTPGRTPDFFPFFVTPQGTGSPSRAGYGVAA